MRSSVTPMCAVSCLLPTADVLVPYSSFVCHMCKSAHQSFSHRVKSVTMSTWTLKEVRALSEKHGGGNKACIAKWLSSGDVEKYRPHPGDSLDKYKNFIRLAYEEKMFMAILLSNL